MNKGLKRLKAFFTEKYEIEGKKADVLAGIIEFIKDTEDVLVRCKPFKAYVNINSDRTYVGIECFQDRLTFSGVHNPEKDTYYIVCEETSKLSKTNYTKTVSEEEAINMIMELLFKNKAQTPLDGSMKFCRLE